MVFEELKGRTFSTIETREWTFGDSLYKLSYQYYNTIEFWWVIALVNNKPTDAHFKFGDMITIPANPDIFNNLDDLPSDLKNAWFTSHLPDNCFYKVEANND